MYLIISYLIGHIACASERTVVVNECNSSGLYQEAWALYVPCVVASRLMWHLTMVPDEELFTGRERITGGSFQKGNGAERPNYLVPLDYNDLTKETAFLKSAPVYTSFGSLTPAKCYLLQLIL